MNRLKNIDFRDIWLSSLGTRLDIPDLAFDDNGLCQLIMNGGMAVTIFKSAETDNLVLSGQLPVDNVSVELMQMMLIENRNHMKQNAPILSLSEQKDAIELHFKFKQSEHQEIQIAVDQLVASLEYWRDMLDQH